MFQNKILREILGPYCLLKRFEKCIFTTWVVQLSHQLFGGRVVIDITCVYFPFYVSEQFYKLYLEGRPMFPVYAKSGCFDIRHSDNAMPL